MPNIAKKKKIMIARKRLPPSKEAERESDQHFRPRKVGQSVSQGWWHGGCSVLRGALAVARILMNNFIFLIPLFLLTMAMRTKKKRRKLSAFSLV